MGKGNLTTATKTTNHHKQSNRYHGCPHLSKALLSNCLVEHLLAFNFQSISNSGQHCKTCWCVRGGDVDQVQGASHHLEDILPALQKNQTGKRTQGSQISILVILNQHFHWTIVTTTQVLDGYSLNPDKVQWLEIDLRNDMDAIQRQMKQVIN